MVGPIIQQILLISYGNEYFKSGFMPEDYDVRHYELCDKVEFFVKKENEPGGWKEIFNTEKPSSWLMQLKKHGCKKLRIQYRHSDKPELDWQIAGFVGGGGTWIIKAIYDTFSDYWTDNWEVIKKNPTDKTIWEVKYNLCGTDDDISESEYCLEDIKQLFSQSLNSISNFATKQNVEIWSKEHFEKALDTLNSMNPEAVYYKDLIHKRNYSLIARQLLFAANRAWVFGGMGWWNDYDFGDATYEDMKLSADLYDCICLAIEASVNSF